MEIYNIIQEYFNKKKYSKITEEEIKNIYKGIIDICQKNNLNTDELKYLSEGESSIAFECMGKVIKFVPVAKETSLTEYLKDSKLILAPIDEILIPINYAKNHSYNMSIILEEKLKPQPNLTTQEIVYFAEQLFNNGYIWLDLRPENLAIDSQGKIKLIDYGELFNRRYDKDYKNHLASFKTIIEIKNKEIKNNKKWNFFRR